MLYVSVLNFLVINIIIKIRYLFNNINKRINKLKKKEKM